MKGEKQKKLKLKDVDFIEVDFDVGNGLERYEKKVSVVILKGNFVLFLFVFYIKGWLVDVNGDLDFDFSVLFLELDMDYCYCFVRFKGNILSSIEGYSLNIFDSLIFSMLFFCDDFLVFISFKKNSVVVEKLKVDVFLNKSEV